MLIHESNGSLATFSNAELHAVMFLMIDENTENIADLSIKKAKVA